ncbi:MAG: lipid-A-disaccharide synthase [Rickettsiales bacterium]|jgi:lipid-A-disaccharide synthase|nr:lipid-A-disaccharide synthase [Rickettsiales bacterium]
MKKKILLIAGEKSGDLLGSKIIEQLDKNIFEISVAGGSLMEEKSGQKSLFPIADTSVMGFFEILPRLFKIMKIIEKIAKFAVETSQDAILTIDSPDFCFRIAKKIRKLAGKNRIKIFHLVAPSVWFYRAGRAKKIAKIYNGLFCILPFEPPYFEKYGLKTIFVGHPIFEKKPSEDTSRGDENTGLLAHRTGKTILLTPGSRIGEVNRILPLMVEVTKNLRKKYNFHYSVFTTEDTTAPVKKYLEARNIDYIDVVAEQEEKENILEKTLLALAKSGTNTLEIAAHAVPLVIVYKFNFLTNILASLLLKIKSGKIYVNLVNILAGREIIPELILRRCTIKNIEKSAIELIEDEKSRDRQVENNLEILKNLGYKANSSPSQVIADEIRKSLEL